MIQTDLPEGDITNAMSVESVFAEHAPDVVIHCAAMTAVDKCETERAKAFLINETGTANIATVCQPKFGSWMLIIAV